MKIKAAGELKIHDSPDKLHMCVHVCEFKTDPDAIEQKPSGRIWRVDGCNFLAAGYKSISPDTLL